MSFYSRVVYPAGGAGSYAVTFPYLSQQHIAVLDNGSPYAGLVSWLNSGTISLSPDIVGGHSVTVLRATPKTPLVNFGSGSLSSGDLNQADLQSIYLYQEFLDAFTGSVSVVNITMLPSANALKTLYDYSATGAGIVDDASHLVAADTAGLSAVTRGVYRIATNTTLSHPVVALGGTFIVDNCVLTFNGPLTAPRAPLFTCINGGSVVFGPGAIQEGYPEWWGAVTGGADCLIPLGACIVACPVVSLASADYFISATLKINTPHRTIRGCSKHWGSNYQSTRILVTSGTLDTIQIGADVIPTTAGVPDINKFLQEVTLQYLSVCRTLAAAGPATTLETAPAGIRLKGTLYTYLEHIWTTEHSLGVAFSGAVNAHCTDVMAFRSTSGSNAGNDPFHGFFYDSTAAIGAAGGNASVYITECNGNVGGAPTLTISSGFYGHQGYTDTFITRLETANTQYGAFLNGSAASGSATQDIDISDCKFDQVTIAGVQISNGSANTNVGITNTYVAPTAAGSFLGGFVVTNQLGVISIIGGVVLGVSNPGSRGLYVSNSSGVSLVDTQLVDCKYPVVLDGGAGSASKCKIRPRIENPTVGATLGAVYMVNTTARNDIAPFIQGGAGVFAYGVNMVAATHHFNEVNCTGFDSASINTGAPNKLVCNAVQVTVRLSQFNTDNEVSGVMG